ncbi:bifunctional hydroxymethylpyrimidine kinase/phosphomethylpyrimidine kinase [Helicobacter sp. CLO-3]|uniref:bifunctional hydroxymethylpyrimidine kinase/phosphomethylpyrimidine kinase n=2 Tax=unclassified Helicobacter TaxID=2593540 RepID=UPI0008052F73|nr:bifunctional hydroxymethylpyrimidine kinase/phosphomethylpyrimidine kinase [Helicobacter sp. CLO-3]OHU85868.1 bifunctional hydroxymethylpyrimidine kinase/phosphomethylpyrimidine kinase [Helicobacter sp. CLO-3]
MGAKYNLESKNAESKKADSAEAKTSMESESKPAHNARNAHTTPHIIPAQTTRAIPILSVAGSDCSGGAGMQADLKTFGAHGLYGMSVVLSVVAENTARVISSFDVPVECIFEQFEAVFEDIPPMATKVGMLGSRRIMDAVAQNFERYKPQNIVIDPVMFAKNGFPLMPKSERLAFAELILPFADVLTPNIPEASELCGFAIKSLDDMKEAARVLHKMGAKSVLVKGGHSGEAGDGGADSSAGVVDSANLDSGVRAVDSGVAESSVCVADSANLDSSAGMGANDVFFDGVDFSVFASPRIRTKNTHGTGCTLSSAIASNLALGLPRAQAIQKAKEYIFGAILHSLELGKGHGPTNHFYRFAKDF